MYIIGLNRESDIIKNFGKLVFRRLIANVEPNAGYMLTLAAQLMLKHRLLLTGVIVGGIAAAIFEGGTMGLLGVAVAVLVGEQVIGTGWMPDWFSSRVESILGGISNEGLFLFLVGLAIFAQVLKSAFTYASQVMELYLATELSRDGRRLATAQVMSLAYSEVNKFPPGRTAILIDQAEVVSEAVNQVSSLSRAGLMLVAYAIVMISLSVTMTMATLVVVIILWMALTKVVRQLRILSDRVTSARVDLWRWTIEYLNAPRLLRLLDGTKYAEQLINKARDNQIFPERTSNVILSAIKPSMEVITIFGAGLFLILGYLFSGSGAASAIPTLFVFVLVFYRLKPQITVFNDFRLKMAQILPTMELLGEFLQRRDKKFLRTGGKSFNRLKREIAFRNVYFRYPDADTEVLRDISFTLPVGKTVALVGRSGGGKSTTADLLLGLYEPTKGEILVDGDDLSTISQSDWIQRIGVVDQEIFLLNASVADNIRFARPEVTKTAIENASRIAHAHEFIVNLEEGYDTVVGDRGYKLSGGQQQRIALARALVEDPGILILDEATSSLDTISERLIQKALEEMHNTRTILVIAHRLSTIASADHIIVLDSGQIEEEGSKTELLSRSGIFSRLWNLQVDTAA